MSTKNVQFDIVIIGGGPAGLSATMWADELGLSAIVLERSGEPGGQLLETYNPIKNHLGIEAENGREMRDIFLRQLAGRNLSIRTGAGVGAIDAARRAATLANGDEVNGRALILATGVRRRRLGVDGEAEFAWRGIIDSGKRNAEAVRGKHVVIIGGGDAALENVHILAANAATVTLVHRRSNFSARDEFLAPALRLPNVRMLTDTVVERIVGTEVVESVCLRSLRDGRTEAVAADAVLIRIGVEPNTELIKGQINTDPAGYICVDSEGRTSETGVYAIGDCANPAAPTISSAVGAGATAVKSIFCWINQ